MLNRLLNCHRRHLLRIEHQADDDVDEAKRRERKTKRICLVMFSFSIQFEISTF